MPAMKGQKFKHYPESLKAEAVRLFIEDGLVLLQDYRAQRKLNKLTPVEYRSQLKP
ncbi:hypothetical protein [Paenibacillus etheri]|uniref:hypothetical protein n=1 Tax=Paenibacillus etheri TaxID=1306852 RepID=UPI000B31754D|nr:hypothetical protein [Paenibacillus etheri]